jgi:hypothetical protein
MLWFLPNIAGARRRPGFAQPCMRSAIDTQQPLSHRPAATACSWPPGAPFWDTAVSTWDCPSPMSPTRLTEADYHDYAGTIPMGSMGRDELRASIRAPRFALR